MQDAPWRARSAFSTGRTDPGPAEPLPLSSIPEVGDGDGLLRVEACVLCGFATPPGLGGRYASYHHPEPDNVQPIRRSYLTERVGELGPDRTEICRALRALADC